MDRYQLKNVIIIILLLVNLFLMGMVGVRVRSEQEARRRTAEELGALFSADGMTLEEGAISWDAPPASLSLSRDTALEEQAAAQLLGSAASAADQGGGLYQYASESGEALFGSNGSFEASGTLAGPEDAEDYCRQFCRAFGFSWPEESPDGGWQGVRLYEGLPVYNCVVTFALEDGAVTSVRGALLPSAGTPADPQPVLLSAAGALNAFQQMRRESVAVASSVAETRLCYELVSSGASMSLVPAWQIVTDTTNYYVNCSTGSVTSG